MQIDSRSVSLWSVLAVIACAEGQSLTDDGDRGTSSGGASSSSGGVATSGGSTSGGATGSGGKSSSGGAASGGAKSTAGGSSSGGAASGGSDSSIFTGAPSCNGPLGGSGGHGGAAGGSSPGGASSGGGGTAGASGEGGAGAASFAAPAGGAGGAGGGASAGATGAGGADVAAAFCDDFEDGDAGGWAPDGGSWAIASDDSLSLEGGPEEGMAIASDTEFADQIVEARVKVLGFGSSSNSYRAGIIARYTGGSNYYSLSLAGNGTLRILHGNSTVSGCSDLAANVAEGTWYTLRLEVTGPADSVRVSAFIDGRAAQSCTLTSNTAVTGSAGVFTYGSGTSALFDQVLVYTP